MRTAMICEREPAGGLVLTVAVEGAANMADAVAAIAEVVSMMQAGRPSEPAQGSPINAGALHQKPKAKLTQFELLSFLSQHPGRGKVEVLHRARERFGIGKSTWYKRWSELVTAGLVVEDASGWRLAAKEGEGAHGR